MNPSEIGEEDEFAGFLCPNCHKLFHENRKPHVLKCGHSVCVHCLFNLQARNQSKHFECPDCGIKIRKQLDINFPVNYMLLDSIPQQKENNDFEGKSSVENKEQLRRQAMPEEFLQIDAAREIKKSLQRKRLGDLVAMEVEQQVYFEKKAMSISEIVYTQFGIIETLLRDFDIITYLSLSPIYQINSERVVTLISQDSINIQENKDYFSSFQYIEEGLALKNKIEEFIESELPDDENEVSPKLEQNQYIGLTGNDSATFFIQGLLVVKLELMFPSISFYSLFSDDSEIVSQYMTTKKFGLVSGLEYFFLFGGENDEDICSSTYIISLSKSVAAEKKGIIMGGPKLEKARTQCSGINKGLVTYCFGGIGAKQEHIYTIERLNEVHLSWETIPISQPVFANLPSVSLFGDSPNENILILGNGTPSNIFVPNFYMIFLDWEASVMKLDFLQLNLETHKYCHPIYLDGIMERKEILIVFKEQNNNLRFETYNENGALIKTYKCSNTYFIGKIIKFEDKYYVPLLHFIDDVNEFRFLEYSPGENECQEYTYFNLKIQCKSFAPVPMMNEVNSGL